MSLARIAVVGLGSTGSMALWQLAKRGVKAFGFEQFGVPHDRGAYGGESRVFRTTYFEHPDYVPLLRRSYTLWRELEQESEVDLLDLCGGLMIGTDDGHAVATIIETIQKYTVNADDVPLEVARLRYPQHVFKDDDKVIFDHEAGYLRPELSVLHAVNRATALSANARTYTTVHDIEPSSNGAWVVTDAGRDHFDHVIIAGGAWAAKLSPTIADAFEVRRAASAWFPAHDPKLFTPNAFPPFLRSTPRDCYGIPSADGTGIKLGLSTRDHRSVADPDHVSRQIDIDEVAVFRETAHEYFSGLYPDPVRVTTYVEGYTPDDHGIVGALPGVPNVTVIAGLSGHGFKLAPALGELAAELATTGVSTLYLDLLDPLRFIRG